MKIKTLIVDDSAAYRQILSMVAKSFDEIEIIDTASNGKIAIEKLEKTDVNLVFLDVFMPEMDGIETLQTIKIKFPKILVILISGQTTRNADITVKALEIGALDFILKPTGNDPNKNIEMLKNSFQRVLQFIKIKLNLKSFDIPTSSNINKYIKHSNITKPVSKSLNMTKNFSVLAIASSTGGPEALTKFIPFLPKNLHIPVVLVQHMPPLFTKFLAENLNKKSALNVVEVEDGQEILPGTVYIAPGGKHFTVQLVNNKKIAKLNDDPPENSCRPSADVLFRSLPEAFSNDILCVVLTGMGQDGMKGVSIMKTNRCYCITQSAKTCVVYGMPKAVDDANLSDISLDLEQIPNQIQSLVKGVNNI